MMYKSVLVQIYLFIFLLSGLSVIPDLSFSNKLRYNILIITSYHHGDFTNDSVVKSIIETMEDLPEANIFIEHLDKRRFFDNDELNDIFEQYLKIKYHAKTLNLIIVSDDDALDFLLGVRDGLFPEIPVVFCGINNFTPDRIRGAVNITGVNEQVNIVKTVELGLNLFPATENIFAVVDDKSKLGLTNGRHFDSAAKYFEGRLKFKKILNLTKEDAPEVLGRIPSRSLLIRLNNLMIPDGGFIPINESINIISENSPVPVLTPWGFDIGQGALCGAVITAREQGKKAGEIAKSVLNGTPADKIKIVMETPTLTMFDYIQMNRFLVTRSMVPNASVIINKPFSVYEENKTLLWAALAVFFVLFFLVLVLSIAVMRKKEAEKSLEKEKNKLASLLKFRDEMLNTAAVWINTLDNRGNVILWNNAAEAISGYSSEEVSGHDSIWKWLYPDRDYRENINKKVMEILNNGNRVENFETLIRTKSGEIKNISWFSNAIMQDDKIVGSIALGADITEMKKAEEEKKKLSELLHQSQKMEAIGQLAGGVAHDFNNMLASIMGTAELIKIKKDNPYEVEKYLELIIKAAGRASSLTRQLLTFSRKGEKTSTNINICEVVEETVSLLKKTINKSITVSVENNASHLNIIGDNVLLQNCFMNMGINSSHAMPEGGSLKFVIENVILDENYCLASPFDIESGRYIEISVIDTGIGMTREVCKRIFEPFFTTREKGEGTGLGLASAYGTILEHKGAITVYSEPGEGTVFHIYLPVSYKEDVKTETEAKIKPGSGTILLIDDEDIIRTVVKLQLEEIGYKVLTAENGRIGIDLFGKNRHKIDLIILDMIMPAMGGREVFAEIRRIDEKIPIIISSGFTKEKHIEEMKKAGINCFLKKPFPIHELAEEIEKALHQGA
ncbi:MAG: response regulator [Desulfobacteraceae bacterium]|nr:response regulator [Desulfobacteraceae bacterium]